MSSRVRPSTVYRGYNIVINPSGKEADARTDAFRIHGPGAHPDNTVTIYEHPVSKIKTYDTEAEAGERAMTFAREWIDAKLA